MTAQLLLPMSAKPLPPLVIDGRCQAARVAALDEAAEERRLLAEQLRWQRRGGYNLDVLAANCTRAFGDVRRWLAGRLA